jgi:hypothetical protein
MVEAQPFKKEDVQQADIYEAEIADDIKTRLYQMLNNEVTYTRRSLDLIDDMDHKLIKRNFISIFDSKYQEKLKKKYQ